jgi:hypothetical protein
MKDPNYAMVGASGAIGLEALSIPTGNKDDKDVLFTVRLYFNEPTEIKEGERLMDISLQGKTILEKFDIRKEAKMSNKVVIQEFKNIAAKAEIKINLKSSPTANKKETILSGVEIISETK